MLVSKKILEAFLKESLDKRDDEENSSEEDSLDLSDFEEDSSDPDSIIYGDFHNATGLNPHTVYYKPEEFEEFKDLEFIKEAVVQLLQGSDIDLFVKEYDSLLNLYKSSHTYEDHKDATNHTILFLDFFLDPTPERYYAYSGIDQQEVEATPDIQDKMNRMIRSFKKIKDEDFLDVLSTIQRTRDNLTNKNFESSLTSKSLKQTEKGELGLYDLFLDLYMVVLSSQYYSRNYFTKDTDEKPYIIEILDNYRNAVEAGYSIRMATDEFVRNLRNYAIDFSYSFDDECMEEFIEISSEVANSSGSPVSYEDQIINLINAFKFNPGDEPEIIEALKNIPDYETLKSSINLLDLNIDSARKEVERYFPKRRRDKKRWGVQGSGILLITKPDAATKLNREILLQKRADWVTGGAGKWAFPGGAFNPLSLKGQERELARKVIEDDLGITPMTSVRYEKHYQADETPIKLNTRIADHLKILLASAIVEFEEEVGISLKRIGDINVSKVIISKTYDWHYVTFVIEVDVNQKALIQSNIKEDSESSATRWIPIEDILFKEGPGKNLWDIAFNDKVVSTINSYGKTITDLFEQYNIEETDIPEEESLKKIMSFLNYLSKNNSDTAKEIHLKMLKEGIDVNDFLKVLITIGIHTKAKGGVDAMRNIASLANNNNFGILGSLFSGRTLELIKIIEQDIPGLFSKRIGAKEALIGSRIIRRMSSIKDSVGSSLVVYRGVKEIPSREILYSLILPGAEYFLGNNVSTTTDRDSAYDFLINPSVLYTIEIADTSTISAQGVSFYPGEKEVLISGSIKVSSYTITYNNLLIAGKSHSGKITSKDGKELAAKLINYCFENNQAGRIECYVTCELLN